MKHVEDRLLYLERGIASINWIYKRFLLALIESTYWNKISIY